LRRSKEFYRFNLTVLSVRMRLPPAERRRSYRIHLQIPIFVRGVDGAGGAFLDLTKTLDISATGAFIASSRALNSGHLVYLTVPAPSLPANGTVPAETPPIQARICRQRVSGELHLVGLEFLTPLE
jgi:PilZ domain-containing protein